MYYQETQTPLQTIARILNLAAFAPISLPLLLHLIGLKTGNPQEVLAEVQQKRIQEKAATLFPAFRRARQEVYTRISQQDIPLKTKWLQEQIAERPAFLERELPANGDEKVNREYSVSRVTVAAWRKNNLLRPSEVRKPLDTDSVAALLIAATLDRRLQGFLPSHIQEQEPHWWCYCQEPPTLEEHGQRIEAPVLPCPIPFPDTLYPAGTLLWTPWPSFSAEWKQIRNMGAIRFAGVQVDTQGERHWKLDRKTLALWIPELQGTEINLLLNNFLSSQRIIDEIVDNALIRLAQQRLV